jgi:hypothetical protein
MRRQSNVHDCCTFPANWAIECGWPDPMAAWRGAYRSEAEAEALIFDAGGLVALFTVGMLSAGIPESQTLVVGDVGVVSLLGEEAGAIFTGKRWAFVADRGIACASLEPGAILRCWRVVGG